MKGKHLLATIVLALAAGAAGQALLRGATSQPTRPTPRAASASDEVPAELQWEYCAVLKAQYIGTPQGGIYWIAYFRGEGVKTEDVKAGPTGNAFAKAVAKLGEEGWDMVGSGPLEVRQGFPGGTPNAVFFKRRKQRDEGE